MIGDNIAVRRKEPEFKHTDVAKKVITIADINNIRILYDIINVKGLISNLSNEKCMTIMEK